MGIKIPFYDITVPLWQTQTVYMNRKASYFQGLVFIASPDLSSNSRFTPKPTVGTHKIFSSSTAVMHSNAQTLKFKRKILILANYRYSSNILKLEVVKNCLKKLQLFPPSQLSLHKYLGSHTLKGTGLLKWLTTKPRERRIRAFLQPVQHLITQAPTLAQ